LVKLETDEGVEGWGEAGTLKDRERSIAQNVASLTPYLLGENPFHINRFIQMVYEKFQEGRGSVELFCAMSGVEQALWDIVGKSLNTPVYNLLGGPCREKIRVYASGWTRGVNTPEELAQRATEAVKLGFTALKLYPLLPSSGKKGGEWTAVENVRRVRDAVGPDIDILIDFWRRPAPLQAIRVARMLEDCNVFWFEEPVPSENLDVLAKVRHSINLPVVTGECLYTKFEFRELLEKNAADILNPDVCTCGGILQLREIAVMAEPHYISIAPHNFNSTTMGLAAIVQVAAVIPNFLIAEYFVNTSEFGNAVSVDPLKVEAGYIKVPTRPGLGIEIIEEALKDYPFREFPPRESGDNPYPEGLAVRKMMT
jgi:galactonate dehydratase